jgi:uncharacterized protein YkwD
MGSRHVTAVLGAVILAGAIAFSYAALEPGMAGATTAVKTCGGGSIALKAKERRTVALHNEARAHHGLRPLCVDHRLTRAARSHSREMIEKDYFSHSSYNGESVGARLKRFGYGGNVSGENIAGGNGSFAKPGSTFKRWMNSAGHRSNILDGRFRRVGVGTHTGNYKGNQGYTMYTVDFGGRR